MSFAINVASAPPSAGGPVLPHVHLEYRIDGYGRPVVLLQAAGSELDAEGCDQLARAAAFAAEELRRRG